MNKESQGADEGLGEFRGLSKIGVCWGVALETHYLRNKVMSSLSNLLSKRALPEDHVGA